MNGFIRFGWAYEHIKNGQGILEWRDSSSDTKAIMFFVISHGLGGLFTEQDYMWPVTD